MVSPLDGLEQVQAGSECAVDGVSPPRWPSRRSLRGRSTLELFTPTSKPERPRWAGFIRKFRKLTRDEAKRPEPTAAHVAQAFATFLRQHLTGKGLRVLAHLELLFAYRVELNLLRTLAADEDRVLLLLPGRRDGRRVVMFPDLAEGSYTLPTNLIADNHLWELRS
jgi:hypothetical protein